MKFMLEMKKISSKAAILICGFCLALLFILRSGPKIAIPSPYFAANYPDFTPSINKTFIPLKRMEEFLDYIDQELLPCSNGKYFGGAMTEGFLDGQKFVCMDEVFGLEKGECNVLSFGINNEWSFDDSIAKFKCKVFAFDPTMGIGNHQRSKYVKFYNLGIGNVKGKVKKNKQVLRVDRYEHILKRLKLTNSDIFYLKMDVEGSELDFFEDVFSNNPNLFNNIKQIGIEIHPSRYKGKDGINPGEDFQLYWKYFQLLEFYGFQLMRSDINAVPRNHYDYKGRTISNCYELVWAQKEFFLSWQR